MKDGSPLWLCLPILTKATDQVNVSMADKSQTSDHILLAHSTFALCHIRSNNYTVHLKDPSSKFKSLSKDNLLSLSYLALDNSVLSS